MSYRTPEQKRIDREVSEAQRLVSASERKRGHALHMPKDARGFRACARWLELEARRKYPSYKETLEYAQNQRWCAEMVNLHGYEKAMKICRAYFAKRYGGRGTDRAVR